MIGDVHNDAVEAVAAVIKRDHPDWKAGLVYLEVIRAIVGDGAYRQTYWAARLDAQVRHE